MIIGAGGAARSAVAALIEEGVPRIWLVNRTLSRAQALAAEFGQAVRAVAPDGLIKVIGDASAVINATPLGLGGGEGPAAPLDAAPATAVVMDMVYRPLRTGFLERAERLGLRTVDGLAMLIGQAAPSFEALFATPPPDIDVRALTIAALEAEP